MRMTTFTILLALSPMASATSLCIEPPTEIAYSQSNVVVAATVKVVSLKKVGDAWRQTILWQVDEAWKGRHYKGSQFTTRTNFSQPEEIASGQSFLLLLRGSEPYDWADCHGPRRLQDSLLEIHKVYQEFQRERQLGPNNSFKPTPLRGAA